MYVVYLLVGVWYDLAGYGVSGEGGREVRVKQYILAHECRETVSLLYILHHQSTFTCTLHARA